MHISPYFFRVKKKQTTLFQNSDGTTSNIHLVVSTGILLCRHRVGGGVQNYVAHAKGGLEFFAHAKGGDQKKLVTGDHKQTAPPPGEKMIAPLSINGHSENSTYGVLLLQVGPLFKEVLADRKWVVMQYHLYDVEHSEKKGY